MPTFISFLVFCQAFGASIGAFMAVWSEIAYLRAMRDGEIDAAERAYLRVVGRGLRYGMALLLLASFGLVVVAYMLHTASQPALSTAYWTSTALALLIISVSWALSRRRISFALGSAVVFTAWWFLAYLSFGLLPALSFGSAAAFLVVATAIFYTVLHYGRFLILRKE